MGFVTKQHVSAVYLQFLSWQKNTGKAWKVAEGRGTPRWVQVNKKKVKDESVGKMRGCKVKAELKYRNKNGATKIMVVGSKTDGKRKRK